MHYALEGPRVGEVSIVIRVSEVRYPFVRVAPDSIPCRVRPGDCVTPFTVLTIKILIFEEENIP